MNKRLGVLFLIFVVIFLVGFIWYRQGLGAVDKNDKTTRFFVIQKGTEIRDIGSRLKREGLIRDPVVFFIYIKLNNLDKNLQAGDFRLSRSMDLPTIVNTLLHGSLDVWITFPEGLRSEEIGEILQKNLPQYTSFWEQVLKANEGFLFPDTYLIPKNADVKLVIDIMKNNFYKKAEQAGISKNDPNLKKIVIIASLIEREAKYDPDRPLVASVIYNRLKEGMPLQIDATVQYALGYSSSEKTWWRKDLTNADLLIDSPFNTYKFSDLPPTPIANPGLSSLKAAVSPAKTLYLYYVSDKNGHLHFAKTLSEHNLNKGKYLSQP